MHRMKLGSPSATTAVEMNDAGSTAVAPAGVTAMKGIGNTIAEDALAQAAVEADDGLDYGISNSLVRLD